MKRLWLVFAQTVTVLLAAYFVVATLKPQWLNRGVAVPGSTGTISILEAPAAPIGTAAAPGSLAGAVRQAAPAVVRWWRWARPSRWRPTRPATPGAICSRI